MAWQVKQDAPLLLWCQGGSCAAVQVQVTKEVIPVEFGFVPGIECRASNAGHRMPGNESNVQAEKKAATALMVMPLTWTVPLKTMWNQHSMPDHALQEDLI